MDLELGGKCLQSLKLEYTLVLQLSDVERDRAADVGSVLGAAIYFIAVSSALVVEIGGTSTPLSPEDDSEDAFSPIRELIGHTVEAANADAIGVLNVTFEGGARLIVGPDPNYEAWNVSGPDGTLVVCMPGGELAIWSATQRRRELTCDVARRIGLHSDEVVRDGLLP